MGSSRSGALALWLLVASGLANAQGAAVPPAPTGAQEGATVGALDAIQGEILLAEAKAKLAESRMALAKAEGSSAESGTPPIVAGVFGPADHPYARFLLSDGSFLSGREGDQLTGGYRVVRIGVDKVVIKDSKGREVVARFSGSTPPAESVGPSTQGGTANRSGISTLPAR